MFYALQVLFQQDETKPQENHQLHHQQQHQPSGGSNNSSKENIKTKTMSGGDTKFSTFVGCIQLLLIILLCIGTKVNEEKPYSHDEYVIFRDIMVMLLLGFGYLMTFLRKYGLSAVGYTMLLTCFSIQLNVLIEPMIQRLYDGLLFSGEGKIPLSISTIIDGEFSAATALISYGAIIGRTNPTQLMIMSLCQAFFYAINKVIFVFGWIGAEDVGGTDHCITS